MLYVKEKRIERGLSQKELSTLSGVTQQGISLIERRVLTNPGILTLEAIARAMGLKLSDIYKPDAPAA